MSRYLLPQPYSDDLAAIAELTTDAFGRAVLTFSSGEAICQYIGAVSDASIRGATGPGGATGPRGVQGLVWRGSWLVSTSYTVNDVAEYQGSAYVLTATASGQPPGQDSSWGLLVARGSVGQTGPQGATGSIGATGVGLTGATGLQGLDGATGAIGSTGPQGATGVGLTGATGIRGATGLMGNPGNTGFAGATGPVGDPGATGPTGTRGLTGATGFQGSTGAQGSLGYTGPTGATGVRGASGSTGFTGATGPQGNTGGPGATGPFGLYDWQIKTANYIAVNRDRLVANTSGGTFAITLPANPLFGDYIQLTDGWDFATTPLLINRNGSTISGYEDNVAIDISRATYEFIYDGTTWKVTATVGVAGATGLTGATGPIKSDIGASIALATTTTITQQTFQPIGGLSLPLTAGTWAFEAQLAGRCSDAAGAKFSLDFNGTQASIDYAQLTSNQNTVWNGLQRFVTVGATGPTSWTSASLDAFGLIFGQITVTTSGSLLLSGLKVASGSLVVWPASTLKVWKIS